MDLIEEFVKGLTQSSGKSVAEGYANVTEGVHKIKKVFSHRDEEPTNGLSLNDEIWEYFSKNIKNIEIEQLDENSEYRDILKWGVQNRCGECMYLVKNTDSKNAYVFVFVFFGNSEELFLDSEHAQRCYVAKSLPKSIEDLFHNKSIFVQPFKN